MAVNRGKDFEDVIKQCLQKIPDVSVDRIHDQTNGFAGSSNICDFIVYKKPYEYYFECKTVHGNTLSIHSNDPKRKYGNISNKQFEGLLEKSKLDGVYAGVIVWWVDKDVTKFIPIEALKHERFIGAKSVRYDNNLFSNIEITGRKKRVFFDYDFEPFFDKIEGDM